MHGVVNFNSVGVVTNALHYLRNGIEVLLSGTIENLSVLDWVTIMTFITERVYEVQKEVSRMTNSN